MARRSQIDLQIACWIEFAKYHGIVLVSLFSAWRAGGYGLGSSGRFAGGLNSMAS